MSIRRTWISLVLSAFFVTGFEGVSGTLNMNPTGNPEKSTVIIGISDEGKFEAYSSEKP